MAGNKAVILVVDDDLPIVVLMRTLLREFGFDPMTATTGEEALRAARERKPDLVLVDKNMPGMTGEEVIRALRAQDGVAETPILILSGEPLGPQQIADLGATGAVLKPFDVAGLVNQIRETLGAAR